MDHNKTVKMLQDKISDFTRFVYTLLAMSVFLYIGVLIPNEGTAYLKIQLLMIGTVVLLGMAFHYVTMIIKYKRQLQEIEE